VVDGRDVLIACIFKQPLLDEMIDKVELTLQQFNELPSRGSNTKYEVGKYYKVMNPDFGDSLKVCYKCDRVVGGVHLVLTKVEIQNG